jgi:hypothetical protein
MNLVELISIALGLAGVILGGVALYFQFRDKPNVKIREFRPVLFGTKPDESVVWSHKLEFIRLEIENIGERVAFDVSAIVTFPGLNALPMFPIVNGAFQRELRFFDLKPKERIELWGTWKEGSADYFGNGHITPSEFIQLGTPAIAKVKFGGKETQKILTRKEVELRFQKEQESMYS